MRNAWLIEKAHQHISSKLIKEDILGYCELPQKDEWIAFRRACLDMGLPEPDYDTPPDAA